MIRCERWWFQNHEGKAFGYYNSKEECLAAMQHHRDPETKRLPDYKRHVRVWKSILDDLDKDFDLMALLGTATVFDVYPEMPLSGENFTPPKPPRVGTRKRQRRVR